MGSIIPFINFSGLWINEIGDKNYQSKSVMILCLSWDVFSILAVILSYILVKWRVIIEFIVGIPCAIFLVLFIFIKESPLYLLSRKKFKEFKALMRYVADVNKK